MFFDEYQFRNYNYRLAFYILVLNVLGVLVINSATGQDSSQVHWSDSAVGICQGRFNCVFCLVF